MDNTTFIPQQSSPRFKGEILGKIYRVWLFRKLVPVLIGEIIVFSFLLFQLGKTVFIERVIENAMKVFFLEPTALIPFLTSAFSTAPTSTKIVSIGVIVLLAFLIRHITQGILRFILVRQNYFSRINAQ